MIDMEDPLMTAEQAQKMKLKLHNQLIGREYIE